MGGGSETTQNTQSQSVTQLPPWINQAAQKNYAFAENVAQQPLQQYQGQMVADVGPQMQQSWDTAANAGTAGQDQYNAAQTGYLGVLGQNAPQQSAAAQATLANPVTAAQATAANPVTAAQAGTGQLSGQNLSSYMNPYTQSVINATLPIMQQQLGLSQIGQQNAASAANAYGGSRMAVQQGVTQAQGAMNMAQMAAQLNNQNFSQAQQAGMFDVGQGNQMGQFNTGQANQVGLANQSQANQMGQFNANLTQQAGLANMNAANQMGQFNTTAQNQVSAANQAAQLSQEGLQNQASSGLGALSNQAQQNQARAFTEQMTAGQTQQQQAQNQINAQMAKFQNAANYPNQQLSVLQSALGMTPYEQGTQSASTTQSQTSADPFSAALSGAKAFGSLASLFTPAAAASDRRLKTDITRVGTHPLGIAIHAYRYKGDPKTYPKVVGPMAEDVAKKFGPGSVAKIPGSGGKMAVHPAIMGALAAPRGPAMGPPVSAMSMGGPRMPGPNLAAIAGARPPMGAMAPPIPAAALGGPRMPGPNLAAIASGGLGPLAGPKPMRARRLRMPQLRGALAGG